VNEELASGREPRRALPRALLADVNAPPEVRELEGGGTLAFWERWLAPAESDALFAELTRTLDWKQRAIRIFGREVLQPRLTAWHGDAPYTYSGVTLAPAPWTPALATLRDRLVAETGERFNSVLCNLYRDGADSMGWHADNEKELGPTPVIASVSLGATRRFVLRHAKKTQPAVSLALPSGSLLVMGGTLQAHWRHALPKAPDVTLPRINLTFRRIVEG
jgi:alkylated DNA repair dioxygenase AlkB